MSAPPSSPQAEGFAAAERAGGGELWIVLNAGSGPLQMRARRDAIDAVLNEAGRAHRFVAVERGGIMAACDQAARSAAAHGGVLVAAGGDGTVNCAAQAALRHGCPLGVLPQGTFNLFAREHGIPLEPEAAVRALLQSQPEAVQVGLVNERVFVVSASVGLYPKLLEDREVAKQQLGQRRRWVAMLAGLVSMFEWRWQLTLDAELDGRTARLRTPSLFVCNNRVQLQRLGIDEAVIQGIGSGHVAGLLAHPLGNWGKLKLLWHAVAGQLHEARELDAFSLRSLSVTTRSARKLKVACDGEVHWMELPLRFCVSPRRLLLMVPARPDGAGKR